MYIHLIILYRAQVPVFEAMHSTTEVTKAAFNRYIDWTPAAAEGLQKSIHSCELLTVCTTDQSVSHINLSLCHYIHHTHMYSCNAMQDFTFIRRESLRVHMSLQNYVLVSMILIKYPLSLSLSLFTL